MYFQLDVLFSYIHLLNLQEDSLRFMEKEEKEGLPSRFNSFKTKKGNTIWAGALGLAWKQLSDNFLNHQKIDLTHQSPQQSKLIHNYNYSQFNRKEISENSIYIKSGYGQKTIDTINKEVKYKFPEMSFSELNYQLGDKDIISYAYLFKKLTFKSSFQSAKLTFEFNGQKVDSFYAKEQHQFQQINVSKYKNEEDFVVFIADKLNPKERLYLIKKPTEIMMDDIISEVNSLDTEQISDCLVDQDTFEMPVVKLDCERHVNELVGSAIKNKELEGYVISEMIEALKLNIDETGAKVQNYGAMICNESCMMYMQPRKKIILKTSFWIVMKEERRQPYLCAHIIDPNDA